ncbi:MAG: PAS domain-containing protein [Deltaproteobacteria bacterium]|nr:PAS domain-containing protein [Deltaproteobacteria bacterium]
MIIDRDMTVLYMNEVAARAGGRSPEQVVGQKCFEHFRTADCRTDRCACYRAMRDACLSSSETDAYPAPGLDFDISYSAIPLRNEGGHHRRVGGGHRRDRRQASR